MNKKLFKNVLVFFNPLIGVVDIIYLNSKHLKAHNYGKLKKNRKSSFFSNIVFLINEINKKVFFLSVAQNILKREQSFSKRMKVDENVALFCKATFL